MNKLLKSVFAFFYVVLMIGLFASCQNDSKGGNVYGDYISYIYSRVNYAGVRTYSGASGVSGKMNSFSVFAYSDNNQISYSALTESRTILPDRLYASQLDFYLFGKNTLSGADILFTTDTGSSAILNVELTSINSTDDCGSFNLNLVNAPYNLYLVAVKKGTDVTKDGILNKDQVLQKSVLYGNSTVDLRSATEIKFYLSGKLFFGKDAVKGKVNLGLYSLDWACGSDFACDVGIYKKDPEQSIVKEVLNYALPCLYSNPDVSSGKYGVPDSMENFPPFQSMPVFTAEITPDVYNFTVCFRNTTSGKKYYYTDTIMVLANQEISKMLEIPNVIASKPEAPSDFVCGYKDPSDENAGKYDIRLDWKDNSVNEEYFKLELLEFTDLTGIAVSDLQDLNDAKWENLKPSASYMEISNDFFKQVGAEDRGEVTGSLARNSDFVSFGVILGSFYLIRLCAVNSEGSSAYVYPQIYSGASSGYSSWDSSALGINRFKIKYTINNGLFYDDDGRNAVPAVYTDVTSQITDLSSCAYSTYYRADTKVSSILKSTDLINRPYGTNGKTATLGRLVTSSGSSIFYLWNAWKKDYINGEDFSLTEYNDFKNLSLFAGFEGGSADSSALTVYGDTGIDTYAKSTIVCVPVAVGGNFDYNEKVAVLNDELTVSKSSFGKLCVLVVNDSNYQIFNSVNVEFGAMGSRDVDLGEGQRVNTTLSGDESINISHLKWEVDLTGYSAGRYKILVRAKKNNLSSAYSRYIFVKLTD
ncbi:MAG: hypothetical protein IJL70_07135 [Treponema sp.]|nr:hypothetical protein [Treponema sp.]